MKGLFPIVDNKNKTFSQNSSSLVRNIRHPRLSLPDPSDEDEVRCDALLLPRHQVLHLQAPARGRVSGRQGSYLFNFRVERNKLEMIKKSFFEKYVFLQPYSSQNVLHNARDNLLQHSDE